MALGKKALFIYLSLAFVLSSQLFGAGKFTAEEYKKALWMATRFYGTQRAGVGPNWAILGLGSRDYSFTRDSVNGIDVNGGWFDCGDHVMFGQTQFYSIYVLLKAYESFPGGFHDMYSQNYEGYVANGNFDYGFGLPNGIPDIIDEVKYAMDFVYKATGPDFLVYQKGEAFKDHNTWVTPGKMAQLDNASGGESDIPRKIYTNPNGRRIASWASAALALGSRILRPFYGDLYADELALHAYYAYVYAKDRSSLGGVGAPEDEQFYPSEDRDKVQHAFYVAASELYRVMGGDELKALVDESWFMDHSAWGVDYFNGYPFAPIASGDALYSAEYYEVVNQQYLQGWLASADPAWGVAKIGNSNWLPLRYPPASAFVAGIYQAKTGATAYDQFIYNQVDYVLGNNARGLSFLSGFCEGPCLENVKHPHHRGIYRKNTNPPDDEKRLLTIPARNKHFGALVGGRYDVYAYTDDVLDFKETEVCIDINSGIVGALGYIVSKLAPSAFTVPVQKVEFMNSNFVKTQMIGREITITPINKEKMTVDIVSLKGVRIATLESEGEVMSYYLTNSGVYHAVVRKGNAILQVSKMIVE